MFLPNSNSFLLVKSKISKPVIQPGIFGIEESEVGLTVGSPSYQEGVGGVAVLCDSRQSDSDRKMFLPNSHSFLLVRSTISKPVIQSDIAESATSLSRLRESRIPLATGPSSADSDSGKPTIGDKNKRAFLKVAGIAGASLVGSLLLPKKADALIMGSSPTTGVVGVKNSTNARINPATEETLGNVLKKADLALTAGVLDVKVTSTSGEGSSSFSDSGGVARSALVDAQRHVQVDVLTSALPSSASTETTLQTIAFGGTSFALRLATVGDIDYVGEAQVNTLDSAALWRIKRVDSASGIIIKWADGNGNFDNIWDNHASLSYS